MKFLSLVSCADLFRDEIGLLRWVPIDEVVVPIPVDGDASLGDHQGSGGDVDERAARTEARSGPIKTVNCRSGRVC